MYLVMLEIRGIALSMELMKLSKIGAKRYKICPGAHLR
jgi:hypothetical protein